MRGTVCMCACPCLFKVPEVLSVQLLNALLELFGLLDVASGCVQAGFDVLDLNTQVLNLQVYRTQRGAQGVALWNSKVCVRVYVCCVCCGCALFTFCLSFIMSVVEACSLRSCLSIASCSARLSLLCSSNSDSICSTHGKGSTSTAQHTPMPKLATTLQPPTTERTRDSPLYTH